MTFFTYGTRFPFVFIHVHTWNKQKFDFNFIVILLKMFFNFNVLKCTWNRFEINLKLFVFRLSSLTLYPCFIRKFNVKDVVITMRMFFFYEFNELYNLTDATTVFFIWPKSNKTTCFCFFISTKVVWLRSWRSTTVMYLADIQNETFQINFISFSNTISSPIIYSFVI